MRIGIARNFNTWVLLLVASLFTACGGGGGGGDPQDPGPGGGGAPDTTPPVTTILSAPQTITQSTDATFAFEANEDGATFEANVDGGGFAPTTSPLSLSGLSLGNHVVELRARDAAGNLEDPAKTHAWEIVAPSTDTTPPNTTLTSGPSGTINQRSATFEFTSDDSTAIFEGSLNGEAFQRISSPHELTGLVDGSHIFRIRAVDPAANVDATPAEVQWSVDATPPTTTVSSGPSGTVNQNSATFTFTSNDTTATFEGSLDNEAFTAISSPLTVNNLSEGSHTMRIRATDGVGNVESPPVAVTWSVATSATPTLSVIFPPPASLTDSSQITLTGKIDSASSVTGVKVNNQNATSSDGFSTWQATVDLAIGANTIDVSAVNAGGAALGNSAQVTVRRVATLLAEPDRVVWDSVNNRGFVADGSRILRLDPDGSLAELTTMSSSDGPVLTRPRGLALTSLGDKLYVADMERNAVIQIDIATGSRTEISGSGRGTGTALENPTGLAFGVVDGVPRLYTTDGAKVIAIDLASGNREVLASEVFALYTDIAFDAANSRLLVLDLFRPYSVLSVDLSASAPVTPSVFSGSTATGTTVGSGTAFDQTWRISIDAATAQVLVTDQGRAAVFAVSLSNGNRQVVGTDQSGAPLRLITPRGVSTGPNTGKLLVADFDLSTIVAVDRSSGAVARYLEDGVGQGPSLVDVSDIAVDPDDDRMYAINRRSFSVLRIDTNTGNREVVASNSSGSGPQIGQSRQLTVNAGMATILASPAGGSFNQIGTFAANLSSGSRSTIISDFTSLGAGYTVPDNSDLVVNRGGTQAWVGVPYSEEDPDTGGVLSSLDTIVTVDLAARSADVLSGPPGVGSGPTLGNGQSAGIALNDDDNELLVIGDQDGYVAGVSLTNGVRRVISNNSNATAGPALISPAAILYDKLRRRALVADDSVGGIISVGLTSGALGRRALFSVAAIQGPALQLPSSLARTEAGLILVYDRGRRAVFAVDPVSGERVIAAR